MAGDPPGRDRPGGSSAALASAAPLDDPSRVEAFRIVAGGEAVASLDRLPCQGDSRGPADNADPVKQALNRRVMVLYRPNA